MGFARHLRKGSRNIRDAFSCGKRYRPFPFTERLSGPLDFGLALLKPEGGAVRKS